MDFDWNKIVHDKANYLVNSSAQVARPFERRMSIGWGNTGTAQTVREMARLAVNGSKDPIVQIISFEMMKDIPGRDHEAIARRFFQILQDKGVDNGSSVKFANDPVGTELLRAPWITLVFGGADCDDYTTLMCAMLLAVGVPCFIRTVAVDPERPDTFSHVYAVAVIRPYNGQEKHELAMDCSVPFSKPGSEPQSVYKKKDWFLGIKTESDW